MLYTGTSLYIVCTLELSTAVESGVGVTGIWRRGGEVIVNSSRVSISETALIRPFVYQTTISISPLSHIMDSGQYSCQSSIMSSPFVRFASGSQQVAVNIEGKLDPQYYAAAMDVVYMINTRFSSTTPCCHDHQ